MYGIYVYTRTLNKLLEWLRNFHLKMSFEDFFLRQD